jgi:hypothetical protein
MQATRTTAEVCRERAAECRQMARVASQPSHEIMLNHMAETWERIALDVENNNGDSQTPPP